VQETQRCGRPGVGEETAPRSQHDRVDQQDKPVDEVACHQRLDQFSTAEDHQILSRRLLEPGYGVGGVAFEECGVAPRKRLLQGSRRDVLLGVVEDVGEGIVPLFGPETGEVLVGPPPQQERPTSGHALRRRRAGDGIHPWGRPAAVLGAAAPVLVGAARCLHGAVERDVVEDNDFAHLALPSALPETGAGNRTERRANRRTCRSPSITEIPKYATPQAAATTLTTGPGALSATATSAPKAPARPALTKVMNVPLLASGWRMARGPARWL